MFNKVKQMHLISLNSRNS